MRIDDSVVNTNEKKSEDYKINPAWLGAGCIMRYKNYIKQVVSSVIETTLSRLYPASL